MAKKIINTTQISREKWLEYRRKGIGGSDAATIIGLNPYKSRLELYAEKLGFMSEKEDTEAMRTGRDLEAYVAQRFTEATGKKVRRNNFMWKHDEHSFMIADVDREIVGENSGLECKTTSVWNKSDFGNGEIPLTYYVQCMHYMATMGYDRMYLAILILGKGFFWFTIERNDEEIAALIESEKAYWNDHILKGLPPSPDGSESSDAATKALTVSGKELYNDDLVLLYDYSKVLEELKEITEHIDRLSNRAESIKQSIKMVLKDSTNGSDDKFSVTYKPQSRTVVDSEKLRALYPEIYRICCKTTHSRVLRIKEKKEI